MRIARTLTIPGVTEAEAVARAASLEVASNMLCKRPLLTGPSDWRAAGVSCRIWIPPRVPGFADASKVTATAWAVSLCDRVGRSRTARGLESHCSTERVRWSSLVQKEDGSRPSASTINCARMQRRPCGGSRSMVERCRYSVGRRRRGELLRGDSGRERCTRRDESGRSTTASRHCSAKGRSSR